jgi:quercetin dioxygenase-like cupin family protein
LLPFCIKAAAKRKPSIVMATPVRVNKLEAKAHSTADEVRTPDKTRVEVNHLDGFSIGRFNLQPGWRWSECIKPVVQTDHCQLSHVGYAVSGKITIRMSDGTEQTISAGDSYTIPPGHDAWVEGNESFVGIEVLSADEFAKAQP